MPSPGDMFKSYGFVRVSLVEADEGIRKTRSDMNHYRFYVSVSLVDDKESTTLGKFSSACYLFSPSRNPSRMDEEFLFDGVSSSHSLVISINIIGDGCDNSCQQTTIPVSRLEEDKEIFQWYQMYSSSSSSSSKGETETPTPGGALKLQIVYMKVALPPISRNTYSVAQSGGPTDYLMVADDTSECSFLVDKPSLTQTLQTPIEAPTPPPPPAETSPIQSQATADKVLVSILKSPSRRASYNSNISSRKDDIRATFSEDLAVTCGEKRESSGSKKEKPARSFSFSLNEKVLVDEGEGDGDGEERLTVGLIDYAFLIGPLDDASVTCGEGVDGQRGEKKIHVQYSISPGSEGSRAPFTRYGSPQAMDDPDLSPTPARIAPMLPLRRGSSAPMDCDMCIWDRFPSEDHDESPLPAKIEYFACPDGSSVCRAARRPEPHFSTFILSGAGESDGQYGICLTSFIKCYANLKEDQAPSKAPLTPGPGLTPSIPHRRKSKVGRMSPLPEDETPAPASPLPTAEDTGPAGVEWWNQGTEGNGGLESGDGDGGSGCKTQWTAVTLCFLSRWPHVQQLQQCLHYLYGTCILSSLERWEIHCDQLIANHRESIMANSHLSEGRSSSASCLVLEPVRLGMQCVDLLTMLCLESPVPLWGVFTLNIVLPALVQSNNTHTPLMDKQNVSPSKANAEAGSKGAIVRFAQCPPEDLPLCPYSLCDSIFRCLGPRGVLTVLSAALAESRILFFSSDASLLPAVCESLRTLLYPMKWAHVYLPVVPAPLLDLVQAPVPYILGTLSKWMELIPPEFLCDVVLVDLDTGAVDAMRSKEGLGSPSAALTDMVPSFPPKIERWLLCALKEVVAPNADLTEFALPTLSSMPSDGSVPAPSTVKEKDTMIQMIVFDVMANLLRYVPGCIFSLNVGESEGPSHHVFNRPLFLSDCIEDDNRPFLTMLTDTNAFEQFTESLYSPSMGFYLRSLSALPTPVMSFKNRETLLVPTGIHRKNSKQTHRDVLPLPGNDGKATVVDKSSADYSFPNSVINGGDRLNVVKLPTVSVTPEAVIVTAPSSPSVSPCSSHRNSINSIKGMLLFPTSTTAAQQPENTMCFDLCLARTGSCDSILTRSTDSLTGGSSSRAAGSVSKDRSDKGRLLSLFPDWIVALMANHSDASCLSNVTKRTFIEPIIDFYAPLVMCSREQRGRDDFVSMGTGMIYEGYQPGNAIATQSSLQDLNPFPVLTLTVSPSKIRETRTSLIEQETTASIFSVDSEDWDSSRTSSKSPRLKALRSGSELERELSTDESKSILRGGEARGMVPLSSTRSGSSESRPMSLNLSKTKRTRPFSVNIRPASVNLSARTSTGDSMNAMSPSYLSFLPLIGKTSGLAVFSEGGLALEGESDNSTPTSPNRSLSSPRPADMDVNTSPLSLTFQLENEAVMRRRSYGRNRSGTFGQSSSRKGGSKHARRRHSADSCFNYPFATSAAAATSSDYMREVFSTTSDAQQPEGQSEFSGSGPVNLAEARMDTMSSVCTISSFNLDPLTNPTMHHPGKDGSEKVPSPVSMCLCPPLIFDTESLEMAVGQIEEWTVGELAGALKQPIKSFLKNLKGEAERSTDPFSPWTSNNSATPPAESAKSSVNARSPSRRWPNRAAVGIGGAITDYLQYAFSGVSMSPRQVEHLERRCVGALELHDNRMRLVHLLRQTNKGTPSMPPNSPAVVRQGLQLLTHPHSRAADLESQLFPLHSSTFELLSKLYSLAVEACVTHRDYLAAYGLLGVGGLYFQIQSRSKREQSRDRHDEDGEYDVARETEFLCERISQHPIFQSPYLWMTVMRSKLSAYQRGPSASPSVSSPTAKKEEIKSDPDGVECDVDALFLEAYALLFIINRLGVNYERAAAFNKMVVSDYSLAKGHYLQLQQYTDELYSPQVSCLNQVNRQYSREAAGFRSRSRSDTPQVLRLAHPQKLKLKARNFSPLSQREGTLIFHKESSMCWDGEGEGEGSADPGTRPIGPLSATDEGTCAVLADLTTLLPCAPPACADSGGSTTPPLSWSASMRTSISPTNASKERNHSTPFLRSLIRPAKEPVEVASTCIKSHGYAPHPRSEEQTRGRNRGKRTAAEIKAPPSETISPKRKASVIATRLKNYFMRKVSVTTTDGSKDGDAGEGEKDSSPSTAPKASSGSRSQDDRNSVSTLLPHSNTPEKSKGMKCIELNQQNYYSIPLEGSMLDHPVCADTVGRFLMAGLRDGSVNINNLTTGALVMRVTHSTSTARSSSSSSSKSAGDAARFSQPYAGVTHVQCFPMQSPCPCTPLDPPSAAHSHAPAFASACSNGVVRIWRLLPYFYAASGASGGANEGEGALEDDPVLGEQAAIQSHQGEAVTCLRAEWAGSTVGPNHPCGWWVVTGDRKGLIVISSGEFSPVPKGYDVTAEDESIKSTVERRGGISNGISRHHQMSVKSVPIRTLSSDGEITCLAFTRSRSRSKSRINEKNSVEEGRGRVSSSSSVGGTFSEREVEGEGEMVAAGTAAGRIAIFDLHSGQCRFVLKGHSGRVAAIVCPSLHLSAVDSLGMGIDMGMEGTLIASCGLDRRVLLWDTSHASRVRARAASSVESAAEIAMGDAIARKIKSSSSDSRRGSRGEAEGESKVTEQQLPLAIAIEPCMLYASGVYRGAEDAVRSAPGPLVGLCVCPSHCPASSKQKRLLGSEQEGGSEHRGGSFVLAAASADGSLLLWDVAQRPAKGYIGSTYMSSASSLSSRATRDENALHRGDAQTGPSNDTNSVRLEAGPMRLLRGHSDRVTHMKYRPCGSIETSSLDGTMRIWTRAPTPSSSPSLCNLANGASSSTGVVTPLSPACGFPSVPCPPSPPPPPPLSSLFSPPGETENPYACSAVMKLFGSATDDNVGIASFSGACCEIDRSNKHVESSVARSISPLRSLFSECSSETLETSSGPNSTAGVSVVEGKDNNAPDTSAGIGSGAGADTGAGVNLKGKSWLVAVSLGGFMKAFITPSFSYAPTSSPDPPSNLTSPDANKEAKRIHM